MMTGHFWVNNPFKHWKKKYIFNIYIHFSLFTWRIYDTEMRTAIMGITDLTVLSKKEKQFYVVSDHNDSIPRLHTTVRCFFFFFYLLFLLIIGIIYDKIVRKSTRWHLKILWVVHIHHCGKNLWRCWVQMAF